MNPFIVGVCGGTASGKTTLANEVAKDLSASLISHDWYYRTAPPDAPRPYNYDHPDAYNTPLLIEHLHALRKGQRVMAPNYEFSTGISTPDVKQVSPTPVMVVEGILIAAEMSLVQMLDLTVFVEAPDDIRLARRIRRDIKERGQSVDSVLDRYLSQVRPMHEKYVAPARELCDLRVDGTQPVDKPVSIVFDKINLKRQGYV